MANEFNDQFMPPSPRETWVGKIFTRGTAPEVGATGPEGMITGRGPSPAAVPTAATTPENFTRSFLGPNDLSMEQPRGTDLVLPPGRYGTPNSPMSSFLPSPADVNLGIRDLGPIRYQTPIQPITPTVKTIEQQAHEEAQRELDTWNAGAEARTRGKATGRMARDAFSLSPDWKMKYQDQLGEGSGMWTDFEGKVHFMLLPPSGPPTVEQQIQPLINKFLSQITTQGGAIGPDQMNAMTAFMNASQTGAQKGALIPSEIELNRARAGGAGIVPNVYSGAPGQVSSYRMNTTTGQMEPFASGTHPEAEGPLMSSIAHITANKESERAKLLAADMNFMASGTISPGLQKQLDDIESRHQKNVDFLRNLHMESRRQAMRGSAGPQSREEYFKALRNHPDNAKFTDKQLDEYIDKVYGK